MSTIKHESVAARHLLIITRSQYLKKEKNDLLLFRSICVKCTDFHCLALGNMLHNLQTPRNKIPNLMTN